MNVTRALSMKTTAPSILDAVVPTADEVRQIRERAGFTQKQFARLLVTTLDRMKKYESGKHAMKPSMWLLARITCDSLTRARWAQAIARSENSRK